MTTDLLHTVFEHMAARRPWHPAVEEEGRHTSYHQLNRRANRLAHTLRWLGVGRDEVVGVLMPPTAELVVSLMGIFKSGGVYLPIDVAFPKGRLAALFTQTCCQCLVTTRAGMRTVEAWREELGIVVPNLVVLDGQSEQEELYLFAAGAYHRSGMPGPVPDHNPVVINAPDDGNYVFYTSGSTGAGKAMLGCHKSLSHFIHWEIKEFGIDHTARVSQLAQFTFDASLRDVFVPLCSGGTLCMPGADTRTDIGKLVAWIELSLVSLIHCVPSVFRVITKELRQAPVPAPRFPALRHVLMAGEALYGKDVRNWTDAVGPHAELVNLYGTSETTLAKTFHRIREVPENPGQLIHAGKPIEGAFIAIVNGDRLCQGSEIGEIYIKTPFMTKGYLHDPALTATVFVQNPLVKDKADVVHRTGDFGRYLKDRSVEVLGRKDDRVKVNGIQVEPGQVDRAVLGIGDVQEVLTVAQANADNTYELICYYVSSRWGTEDLRRLLRHELSPAMIPAYYIRMEAFPLTLNGKVDKRALPRPESLLFSEAEYEPALDQVEAALERIWKGVLQLERIGRKVPFFQVGGNSLKAMQVISRIGKEFGDGIRLSDLLANPTVGQLGEILRNAGAPTDHPIGKLAPQEHYDVSHGQARFWVSSQFDNRQEGDFTISRFYVLTGELDRAALQRAFHQLVQRHESLRTRFVLVDDALRQVIEPPEAVPFALDFLDLRLHADPEAEARQLAARHARCTFDLARAPLLKVTLLRLAAERYLLLFSVHHIIADGWSLEVAARDVLTLYDAFRRGQADPLPPLTIQTKEYAAWQRRQLSGEKGGQLRSYWRRRFEGPLPVLELPCDDYRRWQQQYEDALRADVSSPAMAKAYEDALLGGDRR